MWFFFKTIFYKEKKIIQNNKLNKNIWQVTDWGQTILIMKHPVILNIIYIHQIHFPDLPLSLCTSNS